VNVEVWRDAHGTEWELVILGDGDCLVRQGINDLDRADGDVREGVEVLARFADAEDARAFLWDEGFDPVRED